MLISYTRSKNAEAQVRTINEPCSFLGIIYLYLIVLPCREDLKRHKYDQQYSLQIYFSDIWIESASECIQRCKK